MDAYEGLNTTYYEDIYQEYKDLFSYDEFVTIWKSLYKKRAKLLSKAFNKNHDEYLKNVLGDRFDKKWKDFKYFVKWSIENGYPKFNRFNRKNKILGYTADNVKLMKQPITQSNDIGAVYFQDFNCFIYMRNLTKLYGNNYFKIGKFLDIDNFAINDKLLKNSNKIFNKILNDEIALNYFIPDDKHYILYRHSINDFYLVDLQASYENYTEGIIAFEDKNPNIEAKNNLFGIEIWKALFLNPYKKYRGNYLNYDKYTFTDAFFNSSTLAKEFIKPFLSIKSASADKFKDLIISGYKERLDNAKR